ncbi:MAG TPA: flagellar biosynthesis anti-sigma factor FlgM [Acetobacteraceae bacterium]|nr:flagellar biosynthesis anti-sigma factor FlgM [Acetobacteraceae bacterium]
MTTPISSSVTSSAVDRASDLTVSADSGATTSGPPDSSQGQDRVELSEQAGAAETILAAANQPASGAPDPALVAISQDVANGTYQPSSTAVAEALVRYERRLLQGG